MSSVLRHLFASSVVGLAAVGAVWAAKRWLPRAEFLAALHDREFVMARPADEPRRIEPGKAPLDLAFAYADFDLTATVELATGAVLDLVFRRVLPGAEAPHARFSVLRVSTTGEGPGLLTREQALFGGGGGVPVAAGRPATIVLRGRGRRITATVAGRRLGPFESVDTLGDFAFVARGGAVLLRYLRIEPREEPPRPRAWWVALAIGVAVGATLLATGVPWGRLAACAAVVLPGGGLLGGWLVLACLLPGVAPSLEATLLASLGALPLLVALPRPRWWSVALCAIVMLGTLEGAARLERARLAPFRDPRMDLWFGVRSGVAAYEALARIVTTPWVVHTLEPAGRRVVLLGGAPLYWAGPPDAPPAVLLQTRLRTRLRRPFEVVAFPTPNPCALQQWLLFRTFYADYSPEALVFGVSELEGFPAERVRPRVRWRRLSSGDAEGPGAPGSVLVELQRRRGERGREPASTPEELAETLAEAAEFCTSRGMRMAVVTDAGLQGALLEAVRGFCRQRGVPLVEALIREGRADPARLDELAAALTR